MPIHSESGDIVERLTKGPVLFIGESPTRSLPFALAAMRGSFSNIWAADFEGSLRNHDWQSVLDDWRQRLNKNWAIRAPSGKRHRCLMRRSPADICR
jgi:hypothetical protein